MQNSQCFRQLLFVIRKHGKSEVLQIGMILPPGEVDEMAIRAAAEQNGVSIFECPQFLVELSDFCRANESEVEWPEKYNTPLSLKIT
jgi:hypothetical protein